MVLALPHVLLARYSVGKRTFCWASFFFLRALHLCFCPGKQVRKAFWMAVSSGESFIYVFFMLNLTSRSLAPKYCLPLYKETVSLSLILQWSFHYTANKTHQACVVLLAANSHLLNTSCRTWFETQSSEVLLPPADTLLMA